MTQKEKQLLLQDLSARLPYGIVINTGDKDLKLDRQHQCIGVLYPEDCSDEFNERNNNPSFYITISGCYYGEEIKPYLRPMSSMTDAEKKDFPFPYYFEWIDNNFSLLCSNDEVCASIGFDEMYELMDWLNAHHFDYRGLIKKGLAIEAPKGMYNTK